MKTVTKGNSESFNFCKFAPAGQLCDPADTYFEKFTGTFYSRNSLFNAEREKARESQRITMPESVAYVATDRAERYLKQLARHFGHQVPVVQEGPHAEFSFDMGAGIADASRGYLVLKAHARSDGDLSAIQDVLATHLEQVGELDGLSVSWSPAVAA
ncbi:DUF2218 domain-containing protein [Hoyosella sp. YIM 151337]|uniref:DUF2218 domain-containing protein n=1 Tax=Hoyosella sp. YIM 151337 TaxID=2992742 RepID=UPI002235543B|nr:DUF2218 domain-containing protein [Hoyosella sp. YIM 151337]MCW4353669.1 DUF2218 domain-containing protein [Hoyosella sp. YIM 151337]